MDYPQLLLYDTEISDSVQHRKSPVATKNSNGMDYRRRAADSFLRGNDYENKKYDNNNKNNSAAYNKKKGVLLLNVN